MTLERQPLPLFSDASVFIQCGSRLSFSFSLSRVWNHSREPLEKYSRLREVFIGIIRARRNRSIHSR